MLGVSAETLRTEAKRSIEARGPLPCFACGDRIVFSRQAVENWLETGSWDGRDREEFDAEAVAEAVVSRLVDRLAGNGGPRKEMRLGTLRGAGTRAVLVSQPQRAGESAVRHV